MPLVKFPRAPAPRPVIIDADVWNDLAGAVERLANLSVAAPLSLSDSPAGRTLSITPAAARVIWVKTITNSAEAGGGKYAAKSYSGPLRVDHAAAGNLADADLGAPAASTDIELWHLGEAGSSAHSLLDNTNYPALFTGHYTNESTPRKICIFCGGALPPGGAKYQVLAKIDDAGTVAWDDVRFR
jgi:hypothetical protein